MSQLRKTLPYRDFDIDTKAPAFRRIPVNINVPEEYRVSSKGRVRWERLPNYSITDDAQVDRYPDTKVKEGLFNEKGVAHIGSRGSRESAIDAKYRGMHLTFKEKAAKPAIDAKRIAKGLPALATTYAEKAARKARGGGINARIEDVMTGREGGETPSFSTMDLPTAPFDGKRAQPPYLAKGKEVKL